MNTPKNYLIDLPKIVDPRGNLTVAEQMKNVPFDIARVYWTYDVPDMPIVLVRRLLLPSVGLSMLCLTMEKAISRRSI